MKFATVMSFDTISNSKKKKKSRILDINLFCKIYFIKAILHIKNIS